MPQHVGILSMLVSGWVRARKHFSRGFDKGQLNHPKVHFECRWSQLQRYRWMCSWYSSMRERMHQYIGLVRMRLSIRIHAIRRSMYRHRWMRRATSELTSSKFDDIINLKYLLFRGCVHHLVLAKIHEAVFVASVQEDIDLMHPGRFALMPTNVIKTESTNAAVLFVETDLGHFSKMDFSMSLEWSFDNRTFIMFQLWLSLRIPPSIIQ